MSEKQLETLKKARDAKLAKSKAKKQTEAPPRATPRALKETPQEQEATNLFFF